MQLSGEGSGGVCSQSECSPTVTVLTAMLSTYFFKPFLGPIYDELTANASFKELAQGGV